ncbi:MAG: sodium:solute symporter family protein [Gammaproteobacteria bacterium]|nr:sodium:solute symporter family protein [Gammaproteobacteria bacterium]
MSNQSIIFAGVGIYIAIMILVGVYTSRKVHSATEFIVAGRNLPLWLLTATVVATWFGGGIMIGVAGSAYDDGMLGVIADPFGATVCLLLVGLFFARIFRRLKLLTFVDFVEQRFGRAAALIAALAGLLSSIMWTGGMIVAFGIVFETLTGVPLVVGMLGGSVVIILYTMLGGMLAVAVTDFVQMFVIAVGLVMLLAVALVDAGGWSAVSAQLPEKTFRMLPLENSGEAWLNYARAWLIFGIADISSQSLMGRVLAAKSERIAQQGFILGALTYLAFGMIPVILGIIASVTMPGLELSESVIPALAFDLLHPVAIAIFVGAILAAIMSSCDSALLASASIISTNLLPSFVRDPLDKLRLQVARWAIPACGLIGIGIALNAQVVFATTLDANVLLLAAIIVPFILGVWWQKANRAGALAAMSAGIVSWLITSLVYPELPGDLIGLGVSLATMLIVTPLTQRISPPRTLVDTDGNPVELTNRVGVTL